MRATAKSFPLAQRFPSYGEPTIPRARPLLAPILLIAAPAAAEPLRVDPALTPHETQNGARLVEEFHPDGQVKLRRVERDGKAHGTWQEWFEDGTPRYIGQWRDGLGEGVWTYFHPNGQIRYQAWVTRDIWHGPTEGWHPDGRKAFSGIMANGSKLQPFAYWNESGERAGPVPTPAGDQRLRLFGNDWPAGLNRWDFTFTPDLETLFFATGNDDGTDRRIMWRQWRDGIWSQPEPAPFAETGAAEGTPMVSPDGAYLYFSSDRQSAAEPDNPLRELYRVSRASGWKDVERVTQTPLYGEITLSLACDGRGALWTDRRLDGEERMGLYDVMMDGGRIDIVASLNDLHTADRSNENFTTITPDGEAIVFANWGIGGRDSDEDLYLARRTGSGWSAPESLGPLVNTDAGETSPYLTLDGTRLVFLSGAGAERGYTVVALSALGLADLVAPLADSEPCTVPHG